jgi:hypothetical protein
MSQISPLKLPNTNLIQAITSLINRVFNPNGSPASNAQANLNSQGEFVKGINFNGQAVTIQGNLWTSYSDALASGLSISKVGSAETSVKPKPRVNRDMNSMLNTIIFSEEKIEINQTVQNGTYEVYLWIIENFRPDHHSMNVSLAGQIVDREIAKLAVGNWVKYGPYRTTVNDGGLNLVLATTNPGRDAHLMGMAIFKR